MSTQTIEAYKWLCENTWSYQDFIEARDNAKIDLSKIRPEDINRKGGTSMTVGDINSTEKGSGARYNDGKPDYSLLVLSDFAETLKVNTAEDEKIMTIISLLGMFQQNHNIIALYDIIELVGNDAVKEATHVFTYGATKYAAWNWLKGMKWSIPLSCAVRHCLAILSGEDIDPESGRKHVGHVVCNIFMLIHYAQHYKEGNDLPSTENFK